MDIQPQETRQGRYMLTFTGKKFYPYDIRLGDICLEDIAHGLAGEFRFGGQSPTRITVAQHSLTVSAMLRPLGPVYELMGLLHDASEAYIRDIPSPAKEHLADYKTLEHRLMHWVAETFDLPPGFEHNPEVKAADTRALVAEQAFVWISNPKRYPELVLGVAAAEQAFLDRAKLLESQIQSMYTQGCCSL